MVKDARGGQAALICGSVAYDTILVFPDRFKAHILPDKIHILNVAFLVPEMRREFGGCAANIAYSLRLLGDLGLPMATAGHDFGPYRERLKALGISLEHVKVIEDAFTAQAFITTDLDDNQITAFHPGAMQYAHVNQVSRTAAGGRARDRGPGRPPSDDRACGAVRRGRRYPSFSTPARGCRCSAADELKTFIEQATWVAVNDYEWGLLQQKTGLTAADIAAGVEALIVTRGAEGSVIYTGGRRYGIPSVKPTHHCRPDRLR